MPKLVVIARGKPREIEMGQELTIGRGYSNLLRLEGDEISRVHAIIYRRNEDFILRDLDSKNGVFLNGNKINHAQLGPGDKVQVGKYKMVFNPPPGFDLDRFVNSALRQNGSSAKVDSAPGVLSEDADFVSSRRFKVAVDSVAAIQMAGDKDSGSDVGARDAVLYSRIELDRNLSELKGRTAEIVADYQDLFFTALMQVSLRGHRYVEAVVTALAHAISADRAVVVLRDADSGSMHPAAVVAPDPDVAVNRVVLKYGFSESKAILCPRTDEAGLFRDNDTVKRDRITSLISLPIVHEGTIGLLYVDRLGEADGFKIAHFFAAARVARLLEMHLKEKSRGKQQVKTP